MSSVTFLQLVLKFHTSSFCQGSSFQGSDQTFFTLVMICILAINIISTLFHIFLPFKLSHLSFLWLRAAEDNSLWTQPLSAEFCSRRSVKFTMFGIFLYCLDILMFPLSAHRSLSWQRGQWSELSYPHPPVRASWKIQLLCTWQKCHYRLNWPGGEQQMLAIKSEKLAKKRGTQALSTYSTV